MLRASSERCSIHGTLVRFLSWMRHGCPACTRRAALDARGPHGPRAALPSRRVWGAEARCLAGPALGRKTGSKRRGRGLRSRGAPPRLRPVPAQMWCSPKGAAVASPIRTSHAHWRYSARRKRRRRIAKLGRSLRVVRLGRRPMARRHARGNWPSTQGMRRIRSGPCAPFAAAGVGLAVDDCQMTTLLTSRNTAPPRMGTCTKAACHRCAPTLAAVHPQILRRLPAVARLALLREGEGHSAGLHAKVVEFLQARAPYLCTLRTSRAGPGRAGPGRAGPGHRE